MSFKNLILCLLFFLTPCLCFAENRPQNTKRDNNQAVTLVSKISNAPLEGTILKSSDKYAFILARSGKKQGLSKKSVKSFLLNKPLRLVIDISGQNVAGLKQVAVEDNIVTALRIGAQKNSARAVIEMKSDRTPVYSIQEKNGRLVFSIRFPNFIDPNFVEESVVEENEESATVSTTTMSTPTTTTSTTSSLPPTTTTIPQVITSLDNITTSTVITTTTTTTEFKEFNKLTDSSSGTVNRLYFQITKNSSDSALVLEVTNLSKYSLSQKDPTRFEIVLEHMRLAGRHVELPQFPPDTFGGFEVVTARADGRNVVINIYVDEGTKLLPYVAGGKLWVKTAK